MGLLRPAWLVFVLCSLANGSASGQAVGEFSWTDESGASDPNKTLTVHYRMPAVVTAETPVWFVLHGASRNADDYRDYLAAAPASVDALIIAPEFTSAQWPSSRSYNLGNISLSESNLTPRDREDWSFSKIEPLFDYVTSVFAPAIDAEAYSMYGHSAGAQFVHRFLQWTPDARVRLAVAANAGWYTLPIDPAALGAGEEPDYPHAWPYSLTATPDYDPATNGYDAFPSANVDTFLQRRLVVLLGEEDTERTSSLRQTEEADAQGPHRFARGHYFFDAGQAEADRRGLGLGWGIDTVPGVGHSGRQMAVPAAQLMRSADAAPGDFNLDGAVDRQDYFFWRATFGQEGLPGLFTEATGDRQIDAADYTVWRDASASSAFAAPEPAGSVLAMIAGVFANASGARRKRQRRLVA